MDSFTAEQINEVRNVVESIIEQGIVRCIPIQSHLGPEGRMIQTFITLYPQLASYFQEDLGHAGIFQTARSSAGQHQFTENEPERLETGDAVLWTPEENTMSSEDGSHESQGEIDDWYTPRLGGEDSDLEKDSNINFSLNFASMLGEGYLEKYTKLTEVLEGREAKNKPAPAFQQDFSKGSFKERHEGIFNLQWCFGINLKVPIFYLPNRAVLFAASHMVVAYDTTNQQMKFLTGLTNEVSCTARGGELVAIADTGPDQCGIFLYDSNTFTPQRCWLGALSGGSRLLEISPCGTYLAAVSASPQPVLVRWTLSNPYFAQALLPPGTPLHLTYNLRDRNQCLVTFTQKLIIATAGVTDKELSLQESKSLKSSCKIGLFRMSIFIHHENQIVTGSSLGQVSVWTSEGHYVRTLQLHNAGVTWLQLEQEQVVVAFEDGVVGFYKQDLRIRRWLSLRRSSILSLSFLLEDNGVPEFAFSAACGNIGIVAGHDKPRSILSTAASQASVLSIATHPTSPYFVSGDREGKISLYHIENKTLEIERVLLTNCGITTLQFSPNGGTLAAGSEQGDLIMLDSILLTARKVLPPVRAAIHKISFNYNGKIMAYAHKDYGLGLYKFTVDWNSRGKHRAHCRPIRGVHFVGDRLFTVAEDRMLAEYDVKHMLRFVGRFRIEQTAVPTSCAWDGEQLLVANSDFRIRFVDLDRKVIMRTLRSPGTAPVHAMTVKDGYLLFAAGKDIGACSLPWQGWGPCIVAHPRHVTNMCYQHGLVLTTGQSDAVVLMWKVKFPQPLPQFPDLPNFFDQPIKRIFHAGTINHSELIDKLQYLGYFPSNFDVSNILRELEMPDIDEETFRWIVWNHGPPPGITMHAVRDALLSVSDGVRTAGPVVQTEWLLAALESGQTDEQDSGNVSEVITREEAMRCLQILSKPGFMPPYTPLQQFLTQILGIELNSI